MTAVAKTIVGLVCAVGLAVATAGPGYTAPAPAAWTVMAYLRATGGLGEAADGYLAQFRTALGGPGTKVTVAAQREDPTGRGPASRLLIPSGATSEAAGDMGRAGTLAEFVRWAQQAAPAEHYALLILAHGVPPAPDTPDNETAAGQLEIRTLQTALGSGEMPRFEVVFLDCCYSGSVEVADRLAGRARYLVAAPGLLYSPGLPWGAILTQLSAEPAMGGRDLALAASREARQFWNGRRELPSSLVATDLDRLPALTEALRGLAQALLPRVDELAPALTLARSRAAGWGPQRELVEVSALAEATAETTVVPEVAEQAKRVAAAAHEATVEAWRLDPGQNDQVGVGLGIFYPLNIRSWSLRYGADAAGGFESDWALLLRAYLQRMAQLARGEG